METATVRVSDQTGDSEERLRPPEADQNRIRSQGQVGRTLTCCDEFLRSRGGRVAHLSLDHRDLLGDLVQGLG